MALTMLRCAWPHRAVRRTVEHDLVKIQTHTPRSIITPPVSAAYHVLGIAEDLAAYPPSLTINPGTDARQPQRQLPKVWDNCSLGLVFAVRIWMLVAAILWVSLCVMGQPVLITIDAHQILETDSGTSLLVCLQLRQAENNITLDGRAGDQILMGAIAMVMIDFFGVIVSAVIMPVAAVSNKLTGLSQVENHITIWVTS